MKIELNKNENPLLKREDIVFTITDFNCTPSRKEIGEKIAAQLNKDFNLVIVKKIEQNFGHKSAAGTAVVYKSEEELRRIEASHFIDRARGKKKEVKVEEEKVMAPPKKEESGKEEVKEKKVEDKVEEKKD